MVDRVNRSGEGVGGFGGGGDMGGLRSGSNNGRDASANSRTDGNVSNSGTEFTDTCGVFRRDQCQCPCTESRQNSARLNVSGNVEFAFNCDQRQRP